MSIKRDDLIHPLVSGNKWRKLSLHIAQFSKSAHKGLITFGGPWSNHLLATASACQIYKISSIGVVRGDYYKFLSPVLNQCQQLGMELRFLSNQAFDQAKVSSVKFLEDAGLSDYGAIPIGGDDDLGITGSQQIVHEVLAAGLRPAHWLVSAGTGATVAGMLTALNYECMVHVYPAINRAEEIDKLKIKLAAISSAAQFQIEAAHRCAFGAVDEQLIDFNRSFYRQTNVLLDPLYNGKMMESFFNEKGRALVGDVLAYHSGGLFGWQGVIPKWHGRVDYRFLDQILK